MSYRYWILTVVAVSMLAATMVVLYQPAEIRFAPDRSLTAPGVVNKLRLAVGRVSLDPAEHVKFADGVLIVRSKDVVNASDFANPPGAWSFQSLISAALTKGCGANCPETPQRWLVDWVNGSHTGAFGIFKGTWNPQEPTLANIPLRLLAVVNRMDLAKVSDTNCNPLPLGGNMGKDAQMCGAEVRFVYAGINHSDAPYLTVILEFVLPAMTKGQFLALAPYWTHLENSTNRMGDLESALIASLGGPSLSAIASARIRVNGTDGIWRFGQAALYWTQSSQPPPIDQELDQQPSPKMPQCVRDKKLANFVKTNDVLHANYSLDSIGYQSTIGTIQPAAAYVLTFATGLVPDNYRLAFSVNSCTGCHGFETVNTNNTAAPSPFDQVKYRKQDECSKLSNFLAGKGDGGEPTLSPWKVTRTAIYPGCLDTTHPPPAPGQFNDLWRRHIFFTILATLDPNAPDQNWVDRLEAVTSVVAWQTD